MNFAKNRARFAISAIVIAIITIGFCLWPRRDTLQVKFGGYVPPESTHVQLKIDSGTMRTIHYIVGVPEVRIAKDEWTEVDWNEGPLSGTLSGRQTSDVSLTIPLERKWEELRIPVFYIQTPTRVEAMINRATSFLKQRPPFLWEAKTTYLSDFSSNQWTHRTPR